MWRPRWLFYWGDLSLEQALALVDRVLENSDGGFEWDDFLSVRKRDPQVEALRAACVEIGRRHGERSEEAFREIAALARRMRSELQS